MPFPDEKALPGTSPPTFHFSIHIINLSNSRTFTPGNFLLNISHCLTAWPVNLSQMYNVWAGATKHSKLKEMFARCERGQLSSGVCHRASSGQFPKTRSQLHLTIAFIRLKKCPGGWPDSCIKCQDGSCGEVAMAPCYVIMWWFSRACRQSGVGSPFRCFSPVTDPTGRVSSSGWGSFFSHPVWYLGAPLSPWLRNAAEILLTPLLSCEESLAPNAYSGRWPGEKLVPCQVSKNLEKYSVVVQTYKWKW